MFVGFTPAIRPASMKRLRQEVRKWRLHRRASTSLDALAESMNPVIRGWMHYYGTYQSSALLPVWRHIDQHLVKWVKQKYRKKGRSYKRANRWLGQVARYQPALFVHWRVARPSAAE